MQRFIIDSDILMNFNDTHKYFIPGQSIQLNVIEFLKPLLFISTPTK